MHKKPVFLAMLVCLLAFGLALVGCNDDSGGGSTDPEITDITFVPGNGGLAADATAGTLSATGGTLPFTFTLVAGDDDTDNGKFTISGTDLKIGTAALNTGTYKVRVKATDTKNKAKEKAISVTVAPATNQDPKGTLTVYNISGTSIRPVATSSIDATKSVTGNQIAPFEKYEFPDLTPGGYIVSKNDKDTDRFTTTIGTGGKTIRYYNGAYSEIPPNGLGTITTPRTIKIENVSNDPSGSDVFGVIEIEDPADDAKKSFTIVSPLTAVDKSTTSTSLEDNKKYKVSITIRRGAAGPYTLKKGTFVVTIVGDGGTVSFDGATFKVSAADGDKVVLGDGAEAPTVTDLP